MTEKVRRQLTELDLVPRIMVVGVGGAGGNAINNMIAAGLRGVEFVVANTDAQAVTVSRAENCLTLGANLTEGLGAGSKPEIGEAAAEEAAEEIRRRLQGAHMLFLAAGMGGGTGTGASSVIARIAKEMGILTVAVVTKPFHFEGTRRMRTAEAGIRELKPHVDTLIVIPNQNLFRIANDRTTFAEAFVLADQVLYSGIACIVDLIVKEGLINLDLADVRTVLSGMGTAMMGTGEASGDRRAVVAAEEAISNPLLDDVTLKGAKALLISIIGGHDLTLFEVDEAATRIKEECDPEANIIVGATFDESLGDRVRVSIVASGMARRGETTVDPRSHRAGPPPLPVVPGNSFGAAAGQSDDEWRSRLAAALVPANGTGAVFQGTLPASRGTVVSGGPAADDLMMQIAEVRSGAGAVAGQGQRPAGMAIPGIEAFPEVGQKAWAAAYGSGGQDSDQVSAAEQIEVPAFIGRPDNGDRSQDGSGLLRRMTGGLRRR